MPTTLDDVFTLDHQNLLVMLRALSIAAGANDITRPALLKTIEDQLLAVRVEDRWANEEKAADDPIVTRYPDLIGIAIDNNDIALFYNMPLHSHSAQFELRFIKKTNIVVLKTRFVGSLEWRWQRIVNIASVVGLCCNAPMHLLSIDDTGTAFELHFSKDSSLPDIKELITIMAEITFTEPSEYNTRCINFAMSLLPTGPHAKSTFITQLIDQVGDVAKLVEDVWFMELLQRLVLAGAKSTLAAAALKAACKTEAVMTDDNLDNSMVKIYTVWLAEALVCKGVELDAAFQATKHMLNVTVVNGYDQSIRLACFEVLCKLAERHFKLDELQATASLTPDQIAECVKTSIAYRNAFPAAEREQCTDPVQTITSSLEYLLQRIATNKQAAERGQAPTVGILPFVRYNYFIRDWRVANVADELAAAKAADEKARAEIAAEEA